MACILSLVDHGKKFFDNKVKPLFGKKSPRTERRPENETFPPQVGTYAARPDSPREGNGGDHIQIARSECTGRGDISAASATSHFDKERVNGNTESITADNRLEAQDHEMRWLRFEDSKIGVTDMTALQDQNMDGQSPSNQQDIGSRETIPEIQSIDPSTYNDQKRHEVDSHNVDLELLGPSGQLSKGLSPYGSIVIHDVTNSGISIGGGTVNVKNEVHHHHSSEQIRPGLALLKERVVTSAFHNSAQRVDPPRCHPNTRVAIQNRIYDWILLDLLIRQAWIMWIHGAAGGGKSAIMQSIAERCEKENIPLASFFFFRTDPTRNSMAPFVATLVYQLIQKIPQTRDDIFSIIENNPLIFGESLESQLQKLIVQPLLHVQGYLKCFFIVMIDGLDECIERTHQSELIKLLGTISHSRTIPVIFLVASRREPQIEAAFIPLQEETPSLIQKIALDNSDVEQTADDIRRFLNDRFRDITRTHLHQRLLPTNWPQESAVEEIVTKSSGQFIYASVVINYVSSPRSNRNPAHLLDIVRGIRLRGPSSQNPFAHLDALYQYIFSQVEALDEVLDILAFSLIIDTLVYDIESAFLLEDGELEVCFTDLTAVIHCGERANPIKFLHASLPDFLRDKTRSERYYIDIDEYKTKLLCMFLDRVPPTLDLVSELLLVRRELCRIDTIKYLLLDGVKPSDGLQQSFMSFTLLNHNYMLSNMHHTLNLLDILEKLKQLNFNDDGRVYHHVLDVVATQFADYWSRYKKIPEVAVEEVFKDLQARISQILNIDTSKFNFEW